MNNLDKEIKKSLLKASENIYPNDNILNSVKLLSYEEDKKMKNFKFLKPILICAFACIAVTAIVTANGIVKSIVSHSSKDEEIEHYPSQAELKEYINFMPSYPEKLGEYAFKSCVPVYTSDRDENDDIISEYTGMNFMYDTDKGILCLDTSPRTSVPSPDSEIIEYSDIKIFYKNSLYKSVPTDYKPSSEEKKLESEGKLQIGYGSDKIETISTQSAIWEKDGISYCLMDMGVETDKSEFIGFAEQIIDMK